jgi:H+/Cl- antiporter ClcA
MTASHLRRPIHIYLSRHLWRRRLVFWAGAIAVGAISVAFAYLADKAQNGFIDAFSNHIWLTLLVTPPGFVLSAWLCRRYFPGAQGSGIPQAMAARVFRSANQRSQLLSLKLTAGKVALTLLGLACGASIGREGPTVQVGASIMLQAARWGGMGREKGLILAGSAAGVAAAFNTPLAGIVFAIEEMSRAYETRTSFLVLSAVILAGLASLGIVGNYSYFGVTDAVVHGAIDWMAVIVCGLGGGLMGAVFTRLVLIGTREIKRVLKAQTMRRALIVAFACGLAVAVFAIISDGETWGTGYAQARGALEGHPPSWSFAPLKLLATVASTLAGIPGGIFAPSLAVGAGVGSVLAPLFPHTMVGAMVVLGMAGYFAGVVQAPITAFVIITEMTADHRMVIPLMIAAVLGYGASRLINPEPLYHALAHDFIADTARATAIPVLATEAGEIAG